MSSMVPRTMPRRLLPHRVLTIHTCQTSVFWWIRRLSPLDLPHPPPPSPTRNVEVFPKRPNVQDTVQIPEYHLLLIGSYLSRQANINTRSVHIDVAPVAGERSCEAYVVQDRIHMGGSVFDGRLVVRINGNKTTTTAAL